MSDVIQLLPPHVANQIAAGEVVQRPASVVKELLENAIDAGATQVQVVIKEAGKQLIQVVDNGKGMSETDARMAFERHATSKIYNTEDIFKISTKGFRGEALASIAAIAQVEMKTKEEDHELGTEIQINGGVVKSQEHCVAKKGTSISVKNLFFNVPARRNFLKSNSVEFRHIIDEFHRVVLAHPSIEFRLEHNDEQIFLLPSTMLIQRLLHVFGRRLEGKLIPVKEETDIVKINGFIAKPDIAKKNKGEQFFFVNNRFIRNGYLHKAILEAFENLIPKNYHPSYFLFLELSPEKIDINIHPTKTEVKFEDDFSIFAQLRAAVKFAIGQSQLSPALDFEQGEWEIPILDKKREIPLPTIEVDENYNPFLEEKKWKSQKTFESFVDNRTSEGKRYDYRIFQREEQESFLEFEKHHSVELSDKIFQWNKSYICTEYKGNLILIDQNRAHQSVLYSKFADSKNKSTLSQQLLFPVEIPISAHEKSKIMEMEKQWIHFGFDFDIEKEELLIKAIPADISQDNIPEIFETFFNSENIQEGIQYENTLAKLMAKAAAVKKGNDLSNEEMYKLLQEFFSLENFVYSPYGKKNFYLIDMDGVKKIFN